MKTEDEIFRAVTFLLDSADDTGPGRTIQVSRDELRALAALVCDRLPEWLDRRKVDRRG